MSNYLFVSVAGAIGTIAIHGHKLLRSVWSQYSVRYAAWRFTLLSVLLLAGLGANAQNQTYYLRPDGDDQLDGKSVANAFVNITKFASVAQPGDQLLIKGGVYYGQTIKLEEFGNNGLKGASGQEIVIKNVEGEVPIFDGTNANDNYLFYTSTQNGTKSVRYIIFDGLVVRNYGTGGIAFDGNVTIDPVDDYTQSNILFDHITVRNCVVDRCGQKGIHFAGASDIQIEDCMVSRCGYNLNSGSWSSNFNLFKVWGNNIRVQRCVSFHGVDVSPNYTDGNGFIVDLSYYHSNVTFTNCVAFLNGGAGLIMTNSSGGRIVNSSFYENSQDPNYGSRYGNLKMGLGTYGVPGRNDLVVQNNTVVQSSGVPFNTDGENLTNSLKTTNNIQGESGYADPQYINPAGGNLAVQSSSPIINAGISNGNTPTDAMFYDPNIIKSQSSTDIGWWTLAPDYDYIITKGGLKNCIYSTSVNGTRDIGATEYAGSAPNPGGGSAQSIYSDSFDNGWYDGGGWDYTANTGNTSPVKNGTNSAAVSFAGGNYGGWIIARSSAQTTSGFNGFKFWAYGADGGNTIQFIVRAGGSETGRVNVALTGGSWQEYTVNFSEVGSPGSVDELWIQNSSSNATGTFYLDDIRLAPSNGGRRGSEVSAERPALISVYPNPTRETILTVVTPFARETSGLLNITDLSGFVRVQQKRMLSHEMNVTLPADMPPSMYIITLKDDVTGRLYRTKFIKQ